MTVCSALSTPGYICGWGRFPRIKCSSQGRILSEVSHWLLPKYNLNWLKIEQSHANPVALATLLTGNFTSTPEGVQGNLLIINTLWRWKEMTVHRKVFSNSNKSGTHMEPSHGNHSTGPSLPRQDPWEQLRGKTCKYERVARSGLLTYPDPKIFSYPISPLTFVATKKSLMNYPKGTGES